MYRSPDIAMLILFLKKNNLIVYIPQKGKLKAVTPDILIRDKILIYKGFINCLQYIHAFCHFSKYCMHTIKVIQVFPCSNKKLKKEYTTLVTVNRKIQGLSYTLAEAQLSVKSVGKKKTPLPNFRGRKLVFFHEP